MKIKHLFRSLIFRTLGPTLGLVLIGASIVYLLVQREILAHHLEDVQIMMEEMAHDLYEKYDEVLNELSYQGLLGDEKIMNLKKVVFLQKAEDFMQRNRLKGVIVEVDKEGKPSVRLNIGNLSQVEGLVKTKLKRITPLHIKEELHYAYHLYLDIWDWHLIILLNAADITRLKQRLLYLHLVSLSVLVGLTILLVFHFRQSFHKPIKMILSALAKGETPHYHGIVELEKLSLEIKGIMDDLQRETKNLNLIYYLAATKNEQDFFLEVAKAIPQLLKLNPLIVSLEVEGLEGEVLAFALDGEIRQGFKISLKKELWLELTQKKALFFLERKVRDSFLDVSLLEGVEAKILLCLPLLDSNGSLLGVMFGLGENLEFSESDLRTLTTIGQLMSLILERLKVKKKEQQTREQLYQSQKMQAVGLLAGGIAHEFNNLLQGIMGHIFILKTKIPPSNPHFKHLELIEDTIDRAAQLTEGLLAFAMKGKYIVEPLNLNEIVREMLNIITKTFERSIEIKTNLEDDLWVVEGDRKQLRQVVLNLCLNARDAMPTGGTLSIETFNQEIQAEDLPHLQATPGRYVVLKVADTGVGMDEETIKHIFEPFFTTKEGKSSGLGLSVVYGVVENHNGFITVESELGKGSVFSIYLPALNQPPLTSQEEKTGLKGDLSPKSGSILIVDDDEIIRETLKEFFIDLGFKVFEASNGQEAIDLVKEKGEEIALVILDLIMPVLSGEKALKVLKEIAPHLKVIVASGYTTDTGLKEILLSKGMDVFITKPYKLTELSQLVKTLLNVN